MYPLLPTLLRSDLTRGGWSSALNEIASIHGFREGPKPDHTVATFAGQTADRGCFTVWESLAARDAKFARPKTFISHADQCSITSTSPINTTMCVLWAYGQCSGTMGDFIEKPMRNRTGAEMFAALLYHCGLKDRELINERMSR